MGAVNALMPLLVCDIPKIQQPALLCYSAMSFQNGAVSLAMKSGRFYFSFKMIMWIVVPLEFWTVWHLGKIACFYAGSNLSSWNKKYNRKLCQYLCCHHHIKSYRSTLVPWNSGFNNEKDIWYLQRFSWKKMTVVSVCKFKSKSDIEPGSSDRGIWETCQLFGYSLLVFVYLLKNTISKKREA